jgi:hypothetical protein
MISKSLLTFSFFVIKVSLTFHDLGLCDSG